MDFISVIIKFLLIASVIVAPIGVFLVKPTASAWIKAGKLLLPILLVFVILSFINLSECLQHPQHDCLTYKTFFVAVAILEYVMFLGWFEYIWRRTHKQIVWPLKENLKYGAASNGVILISAFMTLIIFFYSMFSFYVHILIQ